MRRDSKHSAGIAGLSSRIWGALFACVLIPVFSGCETEVNPFIGTEFPYTVWGIVNPKADTQAVRVFTIDDILKLIPADPLDATVAVIDIDGGRRYMLEDSTIQLPNGDFRHIFWSDFDVEFGNRYRVEVERSDGLMTVSEDVQVPSPAAIQVLEPNLNAISEILLPLEIQGDPPSMPRIDAYYDTYAVSSEGVARESNPVSVDYSGKPIFRDGVWQLSIDLRQDFLTIREDFNDKEIGGVICVSDIRVDVHVANAEWASPTGEFDPNFLVEPGTLSNIENGFGFFGAGYVESVTWEPPIVMQVRAGFADCNV